MSATALPAHRVLFLSHGGGPLPLLGDAGHREMVANLREISGRLKKPAAILVISAHWEASVPTLTRGEHPSLIYDYSGFPPEAYEIQYPAPGAPALAGKVHTMLNHHGIKSALDERRGYDHGVFVPLKIMYPDADIPCVQLSLIQGLDPLAHLRMGRALSALQYDDLLIIGSGFSFHNMRAFFAAGGHEADSQNLAFESWLIDTCANRDLNEEERVSRLLEWERAPAARYCHPREEHLLPLHVCYGVAQRACTAYFELTILGKRASVYLW